MSSRINFVSIKNAIRLFANQTKLSYEELDEANLIEMAADCVKWCTTAQQLKHRIAILQVEGSRARLPNDYQILTQAAGREILPEPCDCSKEPEHECCREHGLGRMRTKRGVTRIEEVSQYVAYNLGNECHMEVNIICPKCRQHACQCNLPIIEVNVDRIWEMSHPEYRYNYYKHFIKTNRFGNGPGLDSIYSPKFKLMRYATNNFFNVKNIITDCPNVDCKDCEHEFIISQPYIEVDFQEGEILLSYLGKALDESGEIMIPDHPDVMAAIVAHLQWNYFLMKAIETKDQFFLVMSKDAVARREEAIGLARAALDIPSFQEFKAFFDSSSWLKRVPNWHSNYLGKDVPDQYKNHLR